MINFKSTEFETIKDATMFASQWRVAGCRVEVENRYGERASVRSAQEVRNTWPSLSAPYFLVLFDSDGEPMGRL